ncbi:MAG: 1-acyl-sn-glycerol-3-phosphate acyltransferase [Chloroflexi bacterium]|nr:1-acyl-sn-glycerol-3-phosphate acyltransferase [Chloroflexota bacterium]MCI0576479.1 1-acyl-sn-glycerol-3-phosphate acyltransferase [Chloroflexota bacterium]MCI0649545.1 1-acyl-sn-glycerol-3-phosphate acyltransferase [Chloroflexota bacterium]MCI0729379.1 1-acyl-sn-glycerol-3-phosphate acyltransferase [Chloroflexota bacterium]
MHAIIRICLFFAGRLTMTGREHIPPAGPYIMVTNHMSKADPPLVYYAFPPMKLRFFAGEKWESHPIFGPLMKWGGAIYINRGEVDRKALKEALEALEAGSVFGLAPEGTRSRVGKLIPGKDGAAYLAYRAKVPLVPVGVVNTDVVGRNVARLRRTHLEVHVGRPFMLPELNHRPKGPELSAYTHLIMVHIAALLPERYWGYYAGSPALKVLLAGEDPWPHCLAAEGVAEKNSQGQPDATETQGAG